MDWDEDGGFLFLENAEKEDRIVICGAGYVGHALAKLSVFAGIRTIVLEDREYFAELAKKSGAHEVICLPFDEAVRSLNDEKNTAYVVMTRGHAYDQKCLMEIEMCIRDRPWRKLLCRLYVCPYQYAEKPWCGRNSVPGASGNDRGGVEGKFLYSSKQYS